MKKILNSLLIIFFLLGCQITQKSSKPVSEIEHSAFISEFVKETNFTHLQAMCYLFDFNFNLNHVYPANRCVFLPNGNTIIRTPEYVRMLNNQNNEIWTYYKDRTHHDLFFSDVTGNTLVMQNEFDKINGKMTRFDRLVVLNEKGQEIKSFSFKKFFLENKKYLLLKEPAASKWFNRLIGLDLESYELTHGNSFIEVYKNMDTKPEKVGYVSNCVSNRKLYFFDKDLKEITKIVDLESLNTHSVQQIADNSFIFYVNESEDDPKSFSSIMSYDSNINKFKLIYSANSKLLGGIACGSVQKISENKYLLAHSQCVPKKTITNVSTVLEFVDMDSKKTIAIPFKSRVPFSQFHLINAKEYLLYNKRF
jgi:hypothetical protein